MSIPPDLTRIVIQGHLGGGEEFATSVWAEGNAPATQTDATNYADTVRSYWEQHALSAAKALLLADCGYDSVKVYGYPDGGPAALTIGESAITAGVGSAGTNSLPQQVACVLTTLTGFPGRRRRGRMYIPVTAAALVSHQLPVALLSALVDGVSGFLGNMKISVVTGDPVVVSQVGVGSTAAITALRADSRLDIQRRRAEAEEPADSYQAAV